MQTFEEVKKEFDEMMEGEQRIATPVCALARNDSKVEDGAHSLSESDRIAEAEKACEAMREKLMYAEEKLAAATKKNEALAEELAEKQTALQNANAMAKQWQGNARNLALNLKKEKDGRDEDRKRFDEELERIRRYVNKPIKLPLTLGIACGVLALLVGVCIDQDLMTCVLGDPLGAGLLAACALFAGMVYERLRLR